MLQVPYRVGVLRNLACIQINYSVLYSFIQLIVLPAARKTFVNIVLFALLWVFVPVTRDQVH